MDFQKLKDKLRILILGERLDPTNRAQRRHTLLIALLAWIGLGADGLSSACYGPEAAFLALGQHTHFTLYLAIAISITVFIIALGYNQVIELFPSGGGGYKVATQLIGPYTGLTSGAALIVDYVLTISISIASGTDALFSLLPAALQSYKFSVEIFLLATLLFLNLRGIKESIKVLMPIFLTFFVTHVILILYGVFQHSESLPQLIPDTLRETANLSQEVGWIVVLSIILRAYSLGGGTYTGIEAVSNNINRLMPPRVTTGKLTMSYMAWSLSFIAGGIILLYLLWGVVPVPHQTLNATTFQAIMHNWVWHNIDFGAIVLLIVMLSEAGLLFVAANTGYVAGPNVLANMASDSWLPVQFKYLSSRLVTQNGLLLMGFSALMILLWTRGKVSVLLVMYSINVFLTFSLSLLGLCIYWIKTKNTPHNRIARFSLSFVGLLITCSILIITTAEKFTEGGWVTLLLTGLLIFACIQIKKHYEKINAFVKTMDSQFKESFTLPFPLPKPMPPDKEVPTAVFFVGENLGIGMQALIKVLTLFPDLYKNFIFLSVVPFDYQALSHENTSPLRQEGQEIHKLHSYFVDYCRAKNLPADHYQSHNIDVIEGLTELAERMRVKYPNCVFFAGELIFEPYSFINQWLHNHTALLLQQRLNLKGMYMMLLPILLPYYPKSLRQATEERNV